MSIEFPSTKSIKDEIRDAIGQTVTFVLGDSYSACPVCSGLGYYDEINEASLDSWCATCFPKNTSIVTNPSVKDICDINVGDTIINAYGESDKVVSLFSRCYKGNMIKINTWKNSNGITCTANHEFKVLEHYKYPIKSCKKIVCLPNCNNQDCHFAHNQCNKEVSIIDKEAKNVKIGDSLVYPIIRYKQYEYLDDYIIDEDLVFLIGWYITEGSVSGGKYPRTVTFSLNADEYDIAENISRVVLNKLGVNTNIRKMGNKCVADVYSSKLTKLLIKKCGKGAQNKTIPKELLNSDYNEFLLSVLVDGDGHRRRTSESYTTVSKDLIYKVFNLILLCNRCPSITTKPPKIDSYGNHKESYTVEWGCNYSNGSCIYDGKYFMVVKSVSSFYDELDVYNIEVGDKHNYIANMFSVNNCSGRYWIVGEVNSDVIAHVRWLTGDQSDYGIAGESLEGDCVITIANDSLTENQIASVREIVADSRKLFPYKSIYRGVPTRDRIRFTCREIGKE